VSDPLGASVLPAFCRQRGAAATACPAYNLANFLRALALPEPVRHWSRTTLRERLVKIGARIVRHGRTFAFQMAQVMATRDLFQQTSELAGRRIWRIGSPEGRRAGGPSGKCRLSSLKAGSHAEVASGAPCD
jgi:hypothetical protein